MAEARVLGVFIHSFIDSFIQQVFIERILCARLVLAAGGQSGTKQTKVCVFVKLLF